MARKSYSRSRYREITSSIGRRPSENCVWAWRLPLKTGTRELGVSGSASRGRRCRRTGGGRRSRVPDEREAEAEPAAALLIPLGSEAAHGSLRRGPERRAVLRAVLRGAHEGLDQCRIVRDALIIPVEIGIGYPRLLP